MLVVGLEVVVVVVVVVVGLEVVELVVVLDEHAVTNTNTVITRLSKISRVAFFFNFLLLNISGGLTKSR